MARSRRPPPRQRKHHRGNASQARIGIVVIFCLLRLADFLFLYAVSSDPSTKTQLEASGSTLGQATGLILLSALPVAVPIFAMPGIICNSLWTTAMLFAVWRRQKWARIILIAVFGLSAVITCCQLPFNRGSTELLTALLVRALVLIGCTAYLIYSRDMHRLTSRERE